MWPVESRLFPLWGRRQQVRGKRSGSAAGWLEITNGLVRAGSAANVCLGQRDPSLWKSLLREAALGKVQEEPVGLGLNCNIPEHSHDASGLLAGVSPAGGEEEMLLFSPELACLCPKACPQGLGVNASTPSVGCYQPTGP